MLNPCFIRRFNCECIITMHFAPFHPCPLPLQVILAISGATTRNDLSSVLSALELATQLHTTDGAGMRDTVVRHVGSLPVWKDFRWGEEVMGGVTEGDGGAIIGGVVRGVAQQNAWTWWDLLCCASAVHPPRTLSFCLCPWHCTSFPAPSSQLVSPSPAAVPWSVLASSCHLAVATACAFLCSLHALAIACACVSVCVHRVGGRFWKAYYDAQMELHQDL